jgi:hypothetical protein
MHSTPNTDLLLLDTFSWVGLLQFPDLVDVSDSGGHLVLVLKEWILPLILDDLGWILRLALVQPTIVDSLRLLHQWLDTVDGRVIVGLVVQGGLILSLEVENVVLWVILTLINEDLVLKLFDLEVPRIITLIRAHEDGGHHISRVDVGDVLLDELDHDGVVEEGLLKSVTIKVLEGLWLLAGGSIPVVVVAEDLAALLNILEEDWPQHG